MTKQKMQNITLQQALQQGMNDLKAGNTLDGTDVIRRLRSRI